MKKTVFVLFVAILVQSCATMKTHSFENTKQTLDLDLSAEKAFSIAVRTAMDMNWEVIDTDSQLKTLSAKTPKTMNRWDDDVNVYVDNTESGSTINVKSKLGHEPNRKYIDSFLQAIKSKANTN